MKSNCCSNKKLGTDFEREFVKMLANNGFWAHFIQPDKSGAQPFDVIAIKDGEPWAFDCKTCIRNVFSIKRMEENQMHAFDKIGYCGCKHIFVAVLHNDEVYLVKFSDLYKYGSVELNESRLFQQIIHK